MCAATVYKLCARGALQQVRVLNSIRVTDEVLQAFVARRVLLSCRSSCAPRVANELWVAPRVDAAGTVVASHHCMAIDRSRSWFRRWLQPEWVARLRLVAVIAVVLAAACGGGGAGTGDIPTTLPPSKQLHQLTPAERQTLCDEIAAYNDSSGTNAAFEESGCRDAGRLAATAANPQSDADAKAACETAYTQCKSGTGTATVSCDSGPWLSPICTATVGEYNVCLSAIEASIRTATSPSCDTLTVANLATSAGSSMGSLPSSCQGYFLSCPETQTLTISLPPSISSRNLAVTGTITLAVPAPAGTLIVLVVDQFSAGTPPPGPPGNTNLANGSVRVASPTTSIGYELQNLEPGDYLVGAFADLVADLVPSDGDEAGFFSGTAASPAFVSWTATRLTITASRDGVDFGIGPVECLAKPGEACQVDSDCRGIICSLADGSKTELIKQDAAGFFGPDSGATCDTTNHICAPLSGASCGSGATAQAANCFGGS